MDLRTLQKEAHAIAKDHGWWDEPRSFGDLIALVHSELSEALEAYRTWDHNSAGMPAACDLEPCPHPPVTLDEESNPVGVASELADVVIRVADMAEYYGYDLVLPGGRVDLDIEDMSSFGDWITMLHQGLSDTVKAWHSEKVLGVTGRWVQELSAVFFGVHLMAAHYGIDLDATIEAKMAYNRTRPYRHGGKAL